MNRLADDIVDRLVADYHADGFAVADRLVDATQCDEIIAAAEALGEADLRPTLNVHRSGRHFAGAMAHPAILQVIDELVGGQANGLQSQMFFAPPGTRGMHAHQDNRYVETDVACFASAWLALVDVSPVNGGLYVYPGSHGAGRLAVRQREGEDFDTRSGVREETILPTGFAKRDLVVARGSVVFLHGHVVHGSYPNRSAGRRYALLNTYLRPGTAFRPGRTGGRQEFPLQRVPLSPAA